jgi:hypothetical protein
LYCNSGRQATLAQEALQQMGYQHVINMGGIAGLNKPVVTSNKPSGGGAFASLPLISAEVHLSHISMNKFSDFMAARMTIERWKNELNPW